MVFFLLIGKKLVESRHVLNVTEKLDGKNCMIQGSVLSQVKINQSDYKVQIKLTEDRSVWETICTCLAGNSKQGCKHSAAVCIFVNEEYTSSKTNLPLTWNKPSESQREKYKKGCKINTLFSPKIQMSSDNFFFSTNRKRTRKLLFN
ncbi:hypothetical protein ABEB36_000094 [Hypothenemus hampei]|uniref:SWIM-type domain-containing protein n=1 Tax=Hypothenemus hampei TaxID=57062 RepID=A0ABD1FA87_HYPHA